MKVIVISDSHGEIENIKHISRIAREEKAEKIIHLGDDYDDADLLVDEGVAVERVPGVYSAYYTEKDIRNRKTVEFNGWKILLSHTKERHSNDTPDDLSPEHYIKGGTVNIVLYGHSHVPAISIENNVYLINPGHLKSDDKRGYEPSFAVLTIEKESIDIAIRGLTSGKTILRELVTKGA